MGSGSSGAQIKGESYTNATRLRWWLKKAVTSISVSPGNGIINSNSSVVVSVNVFPSDAALLPPIHWASDHHVTISNLGNSRYQITANRSGRINLNVFMGDLTSAIDLTINPVLTGDETEITDVDTRNILLNCKKLSDEYEVQKLNGAITDAQYNALFMTVWNTKMVALADYALLDFNSSTARSFLGNDLLIDHGYNIPFTRHDLSRGANGSDVVVLQRMLELHGYFDPTEEYIYGTFDEETEQALYNMTGSIKVDNNTGYELFFNSAAQALRTAISIQALRVARLRHNYVAAWTALKLSGVYPARTHDTTIRGAGIIGSVGYADIMRTGPEYEYIWEVKPLREDDKYTNLLKGIGTLQLSRYINAWNNNQQDIVPKLTAVSGTKITPFAIPYKDGFLLVQGVDGVTNGDIRSGLVLYKYVSSADYRNLSYAYESAYPLESVPVILPTDQFEGYTVLPATASLNIPDIDIQEVLINGTKVFITVQITLAAAGAAVGAAYLALHCGPAALVAFFALAA